MIELLSAEFDKDIAWGGDSVYFTIKWKCKEELFKNLKVHLDFEFGYQTQFDGHYNDFSHEWQIFPNTCFWQKNSTYISGGVWNVSSGLFGGTRKVYLSLRDEDGEIVSFDDGGGNVVNRKYLFDIEISFGDVVSEYLRSLVKSIKVNFSFKESQGNDEDRYEVVFREVETGIKTRLVYNMSENNINTSFGSFSLNIYENDEKKEYVLENVCENEGYELLYVRIPNGYRLSGNAKLVTMLMGGRMVDINKTIPMGYSKLFDSINMCGLYDENIGILARTSSYDTIFETSVQSINGKRYAVVGAVLQNRIEAKKNKMKSVPVIVDKKLTFTKKKNSDWQDLAKLVRAELPTKDCECYDKCLFYKFMIDRGVGEKTYKAEDIKRFIKSMANITDNQRQVVYAVGWQKGGHDWQYPDAYEMNENISVEEFKNCIEYARENNTILSVHDNFEDLYFKFTDDTSMLSKDCYGEWRKGFIWSGGLSYIISPKRYYLSGEASKRIKRIVEYLGIKDSYHIDVTSCEARRYDFSEDMMAAADENIIYKKKIFEEFEKYGIDVTSERASEPFVGAMGHGWTSGFNANGSMFKNDEAIPLIPMILNSRISYVTERAFAKKELISALIQGAKPGFGDVTAFNDDYIMSYYTVGIISLLLDRQPIDKYESDGNDITVTYENGAVIKANLKDEGYCVVYNGEVIAENWTTVAPSPSDDTRYYAYSLEDKEVKIPYTNAKITVLTADGEAERFNVENGILKLNKQTVYRIEKSRSKEK